MRGNGTRFIVISFRSTFSEPSNRIEHVRLVSKCAAIVFMASNGREPSPTPEVDAFLAAAGGNAAGWASPLPSAPSAPSPPEEEATAEAAAEADVCKCCFLRAARTALSPKSSNDPPLPAACPPSPLGRRTSDSAVTGADDDDEEDEDEEDDGAVALVVAFTMSISAWFSIGSTQSQNSVSSDSDSTLLYGLVMTSSSSLGNTAVVKRYTSGKSSASKCSK